MSEFEFTIIIPTHNSQLGIADSIDSIIRQTLDFEKNIEVIIVDTNSTDNTEDISSKYAEKYPNNIKFIQLDSNISEAKNIAVNSASGRYISFLQNHDYYSKNTLENLLKFVNKNNKSDLIAIPLLFFKNGKNWNYLNYKIKKSEQVNLNIHPKYAQLLGLSTFFKRTAVKNIKFQDTFYSDITFFSEILLNNPHLGICNGGTYYSNNLDEKIYPSETLVLESDEFKKFVDLNLNYLISQNLNNFSDVPQFIQFNLVNHLRWLLSIEKGEKINLDNLSEAIKNIDDKVLLNNRLLENELKIFSFLLKYGTDLNSEVREKLELNTVFIDNYDIVNDNLKLLASTVNICQRDIDIIVNGEKINKKELKFPQKDLYSLGHNYAKDCSFEAEIPLSVNKNYSLEFKTENKKLHIDFSRPCNFSKVIGYAKTKHYLSVLNNDAIIISRKTSLNWIKQEIKSLVNVVRKHETGFIKAIPFRIAYMLCYPFLKNKHIWFYMDRPDESDDNGLALFKYAVDKDQNIKKYFVLNSKNKDFNEIKKIGNVLSYKSLKHRLLGMFAENIITSHPDNEIIYPFWGGYPFFAGLLKSNTIFLQHGILKDDISSWLNKSNMNLAFFLVSSPKEYESIFEYPYNYDKNVVQLLGLPRFDTLENREDKKQIIIMPSWRRNLDHKSKEHVKENEFFKKFNSLINNEKLIKTAREHDYEIIFRPHPKVYEYIDLFDENEYVKIDYDKVKYQTLFNSGSLMITDYSSVAFDFAYLYKPVVYYQYSSDYHFDLDDSYYDYETMGFGEIVKTEDELVDLIGGYIENDCKIKDEYYKRINEFFLFDDKNNCKRAYDKIKEVPLKD